MRRETKLSLIELILLRTEVQQLRAANQEADETRESLTASVSRIMASRDHWQREAERLSGLMAQVPPWSLLWWRCLHASKAWRKATARIERGARADRKDAYQHGQKRPASREQARWRRPRRATMSFAPPGGYGTSAYSCLIWAIRITLPHFSVSSAMSLPKSAGEPGNVVPPKLGESRLQLGIRETLVHGDVEPVDDLRRAYCAAYRARTSYSLHSRARNRS